MLQLNWRRRGRDSGAQAAPDLSGSTTLLPGTVILTGTPGGVGVGMKPPRFLQPGDKVVVLLSEYDGGLGIVPRRGGDCRWGAKLADWDAPALESVRYALAEGMEKAMADKVHGPLLRDLGAEAVEEFEPWE